MTTISLKSIGCRTNQEEMCSLAAKLREAGFVVAGGGGEGNLDNVDRFDTIDKIDTPDIIIVNTCSVTAHTESKTRRYIRSLSRDNPNVKILVTGCFAQQHGGALLKYPGVTWVVGNGDKHRIPEIIKSTDTVGIYLSDIFRDNRYDDHGDTKRIWETSVSPPEVSGRTRFSLKIQEGCDYNCAYCIVPSLRGSSRCAPKTLLIDTFKSAIDKGYKEIVLTGTHIGQYRDNHHNNNHDNNHNGLESLLVDMLKNPGDYRIRLSSLDPRDLTDSLLSIITAEKRICDHLHISVQSLSPGVLALMDRPYKSIDILIDRLHTLRERFPLFGLGADLIAGHPGETEAMFSETLRAAEAIGFSYGHVFRYSPRNGTKSRKMPDQVPDSVKKSRAAALRSVLENSRTKFLSLQIARPCSIIIENENPTRGVSGNYIKVEVPAARAPKNSLLGVRLTGEIRGGYCLGVPCY